MHDQQAAVADEQPGRNDLLSARRVSLASVVWTMCAGGIAIGLGVAANSAVLVAFGSISFVDGVGSAALAYHFDRALRHETLADHLERIAHRIVIVGLICVGLGAITFGILRLIADQHGEASRPGTVLAATSLVVLLLLATVKRRLAPRVQSPALKSDGTLSLVGAVQAGVALFGVAATTMGWSWADPLASIAIGTVATTIGVQTWRAHAPT